MRVTFRAALAVALLAGVYILGIAIVAASALGIYEAATHGVHGYVLAKLGMLALFTVVAVGGGLWAGLRRPTPEADGVLLTREEQPRLWAEVIGLADEVGTRPPDEIRLVPVVNAAVSEEAGWLGLRPGARRLYVGLPLLICLTGLQVRSVLAHEMGHYSGRHTALGAVTYRGKEAIGRIVGRVGRRSAVGRIFNLYGRMYLAVSHSVNRRQELEADQFSARIAGRDVAASALAELPVAQAAYGHFMEYYALAAHGQGVRPDGLFVGFERFVDDPERHQQLDQVRGAPCEESRSVYDSHPSLTERIARFRAMPEDGRRDDSGRAVHLLERYEATTEALEEWMFRDSSLRSVAWDQLARQAGAEVAHRTASMFLECAAVSGMHDPNLGAVIDVLGQGRGPELVRPLFESEPSPEEADGALGDLVSHLIASALLTRDEVHHELRWDGPWLLVDADGNPVDLASLVEHAASSPAGASSVKDALASEGVEITYRPDPALLDSLNQAGPAEVRAVAVCTRRPFLMRALLVTDLGLAEKRLGFVEGIRMGLRHGLSDPYRAMLRHCARLTPEDLTQDQRTRITPWPDVAVLLRRKGRTLVVAGPGNAKATYTVMPGAVAGDLTEALRHFLGHRLATR